ncbi:hypothetical protein GCM10027430_35860 [Lysobacter tyrosinilyticus]
MEFPRHIQRQFLISFLLTALSWLVTFAFYQPRSLLTLAALAVSVICGITVYPTLSAALSRITRERPARNWHNLLLLAAATIPVAITAVAAFGLVVALAVIAVGG